MDDYKMLRNMCKYQFPNGNLKEGLWVHAKENVMLDACSIACNCSQEPTVYGSDVSQSYS